MVRQATNVHWRKCWNNYRESDHCLISLKLCILLNSTNINNEKKVFWHIFFKVKAFKLIKKNRVTYFIQLWCLMIQLKLSWILSLCLVVQSNVQVTDARTGKRNYLKLWSLLAQKGRICTGNNYCRYTGTFHTLPGCSGEISCARWPCCGPPGPQRPMVYHPPTFCSAALFPHLGWQPKKKAQPHS